MLLFSAFSALKTSQVFNLFQNNSFEDVANCGGVQSNCNCYPSPFFNGCLGNQWRNRMGSSAVTSKWVDKGPIAFSGSNYAQTRFRTLPTGQGCGNMESFYYDLSQTLCSKLSIGQAYKLELATNGYRLSQAPMVLNLIIRGANGMINAEDSDNDCIGNAGTSSQNIAFFENIPFNKWQIFSSTFTPFIELTQIAFEPYLQTLSGGTFADALIDAVYLTCESMAQTNVTTSVNGEEVTFVLNKIGGPADVSISSGNVEWTFADGSKLTGNPVTKVFVNGASQSLSYWFKDNRCCTGKGTASFDPPSCNCVGAPLVINTNTNWTTNQSPTGNVIIENGAKLNIQGGSSNVQVLMKPKCKIIVRTGSLLNTLLTTIDVDNSECPVGLWGGIEVEGAGIDVPHPSTSNVIQGSYPSSLSSHGTVFIDEASILKRAEHAINSDNSSNTKCGGIIVTRGAELRDNLKGITIGRSNVPDNASQIIGGWIFGGTITLPNNYLSSKYLFGVRIDRAYGVAILGTDFTRLKFGIDNSFGSLNVDGSDFLNCGTGVYSRQVFVKPNQSILLGTTNANTFNTCIIGADIYGSYNAVVANSSFTNTIYGVTNRGLGGYITHGNVFNGNAFFSNGLYWESTGETYPVQSYCNQYNNNYSAAINVYKNNTNGVFDFDQFNYNGSSNDAIDFKVFGTTQTKGIVSSQWGIVYKSALNLFSPLTRDFVIPFSGTAIKYKPKDSQNAAFGTRWVPRCPINANSMYDFNCGSFVSNFERLPKDDNNDVFCLVGYPQFEPDIPGNNLGYIQGVIANINTIVNNDPQYLQDPLYHKELNNKNRAYQQLFKRFNEENKADSVLALLNLEPSMNNRLRMVGYMLETRNYLYANQLINALPDTTLEQLDLSKILCLQSKYIQSGDGGFSTIESEVLAELIISDRNSCAFAQALQGAIDRKSYYLPVQSPSGSGNREIIAPTEVRHGILHPNPTNGDIVLKVERFSESSYSIMIFDLQGRMIKRLEGHRDGDTILLNELNNGSYVAIIQNVDGYSKTERIVIMK